jgi:hypothetical protein
MSKGWRKVATTSPSSQVQFDSRKSAGGVFRAVPARRTAVNVPCEVEERGSFAEIGFVGIPVPVDLALAARLLLAPLVRHFFEEGRVHKSVELIDIHRVDAIVQPLRFGLKPLDRFLVLAGRLGSVRCTLSSATAASML